MNGWLFLGRQLFRVDQGRVILNIFLPVGLLVALIMDYWLMGLYLIGTVGGSWTVGYIAQKKDVLQERNRLLINSQYSQWFIKDHMQFERLEQVLTRQLDRLIEVLTHGRTN